MISLYFLSLFLNPAHAKDSLTDVVQDVLHAEKLVQEAGVMNVECNNFTSLTRQIKNAPLALQCLNSLCPKDDSANRGGALNPYQLSKVSPKNKLNAEKKYKDKKNEINKTIDSFINSSNSLVAQVEKIQQSSEEKIDSSNLITLLGDHLSLVNSGDLPLINLYDSEEMSTEELSILNSFKKESERFVAKNPDIMKKLNTDFTHADLKKKAQELIKKYQDKNELGLAAVIEKDLNAKKFDGYELTKKIIFSEAISDSAEFQKNSQSYLQNKLKAIDLKLVKSSLNNNLKNSFSKLIKANLLYKEAHNCDPAQLNKMVKEIKDNYKKNVFTKFSPETRKRMNEYIDNDIKIAIDEESLFSEADGNKVITSIRETDDNVKKSLLSKNKNDVVTFAFENYANFQGVTVIEFQPPNLTDHFKGDLRSFGEINISALSCANPEIGKGVLTHEIGHAMSSLFAMAMSENTDENDLVKNFRPNTKDYKKFLSTRKCISDYHVNMVPSTDYEKHPGDSFRVEEDMADWFVSQVNKGSKSIMSCVLLQDMPQMHVTYTDLEYRDEIKFKEDPHSSAFFRILNEAFQANNLGFKCESFLKENEHLIRLKKCE